MTVAELKKYGSFGVGLFSGLDGACEVGLLSSRSCPVALSVLLWCVCVDVFPLFFYILVYCMYYHLIYKLILLYLLPSNYVHGHITFAGEFVAIDGAFLRVDETTRVTTAPLDSKVAFAMVTNAVPPVDSITWSRLDTSGYVT